MKHVKTFTLYMLAVTGILYSMASFVAFDLNPSSWGGFARLIFVMVLISTTIPVAVLSFDRTPLDDRSE